MTSTQGHDYELVEASGDRAARVYKEEHRCRRCGMSRVEESTGPSIWYWTLDFKAPGQTQGSMLEHRCDEVKP